MLNVVKKVLGSENDRKLKKLRPLVAKINALEPQFVALTDERRSADWRHYPAPRRNC